MQLIYHGHTIECPPVARRYRKPYAVNWRYQIPGEVYGEGSPRSSTDPSPRVISWRWQEPVN